jgi:hypothetical protein
VCVCLSVCLSCVDGRSVESNNNLPIAAPVASAPPVSAAMSKSPSSSNPFTDETPQSSLPPPPATLPPSKKKVMVKALYDHVAEAEDELNFAVNDMVEVIATSDDGWWKGRCHDKEGLFPVNYVDTNGI